tara:strand:+ start:26503 stop:27039 length:537 start_codon:yes stop_codon:yes gene_type:complete
MEMPDFPCYKVDISNCSSDLITQFLSARESENWLLMAEYAAFTQQQLWTAWLLSQRAFNRGTALARSIDAEFLRYVAGTHHVSEAFKKVGINPSHKSAWIVYLPHSENNDGELNPDFDAKSIATTTTKLCEQLGMLQLSGKPEITIAGIENLGFDISVIDEKTEDLIIGYTISTNLNS